GQLGRAWRGPASSYQSLDDYVEASQEYQAGLVRYAAEHMRTRKFESCWGAFAYHLVDPFPGIGFGLLDGTRRPKLALEALAVAFKLTRVIIEPLVFEGRSEEHTSELQSRGHLVCRLRLEK